jgi:mevalonate kinase
MRVHVPAKIVLLGEYFVLSGGMALGSTVNGFHRITLAPVPGQKRVRCLHRHDYSSEDTEQWLSRIWDHIRNTFGLTVGVDLDHSADFPHTHGWGGSSALILALIQFGAYLANKKISHAKLWSYFLKLKRDLGLPGSGMDVYTQIRGGDWVPFWKQKWLEKHEILGYHDVFSRFGTRRPLCFIPLGHKASSLRAVAAYMEAPASENEMRLYKQVQNRFLQAISLDAWTLFCETLQAYNQLLFQVVDPDPEYREKVFELNRLLGRRGVVKSCGSVNGDGLLGWFKDGRCQLEARDKLQEEGMEVLPLSLGGRASGPV